MEEMSHLDDVLKRLPRQTDENEIRIVKLIREQLLKTEWAKSIFEALRQQLIQYFISSIEILNQPDKIHQATQEVLEELSTISRSRIVSGEENLDRLSKRSPVIAVVNHLGTYKLTEIQPREIRIDLPLDIIHPFPIYYAPLVPVAKILEDNLYETHVELPEPLLSIQKAAGIIVVPPDQGALTKLQTATSELITQHPNALITIFPEGGTTGKRNNGGPYDLDEFKTGGFVIASHLNLPVLPVCQYFNPESGFELGILPPVKVENTENREYYKELARSTQASMQSWLNSRK